MAKSLFFVFFSMLTFAYTWRVWSTVDKEYMIHDAAFYGKIIYMYNVCCAKANDWATGNYIASFVA